MHMDAGVQWTVTDASGVSEASAANFGEKAFLEERLSSYELFIAPVAMGPFNEEH